MAKLAFRFRFPVGDDGVCVAQASHQGSNQDLPLTPDVCHGLPVAIRDLNDAIISVFEGGLGRAIGSSLVPNVFVNVFPNGGLRSLAGALLL